MGVAGGKGYMPVASSAKGTRQSYIHCSILHWNSVQQSEVWEER